MKQKNPKTILGRSVRSLCGHVLLVLINDKSVGAGIKDNLRISEVALALIAQRGEH